MKKNSKKIQFKDLKHYYFGRLETSCKSSSGKRSNSSIVKDSVLSQPGFTCPNSIMETAEQCIYFFRGQ